MFPEFNEFIDKFYLIGFQETRTDELDTIDLKDYILHFKHRKGISRHKSGGIALAYKKHLKNYIKPIETQSKLVYWFVLSKTLTKTNDILCGIVYIPPEYSTHASEEPLHEIVTEMQSISDNY